MLTLVNIYRTDYKKADGTISHWYDLLCSDDYVSKNHLCGSPSKTVRVSEYVLNKALGGDSASNMIQPAICETMVGKAVYVMYNEKGFVGFIRFYDPDEKQGSSSKGSSVPVSADIPDFDSFVS